MVTFFDHLELSALQGLPWRAQLVYIHGIKPYMDSKSGVVGLRRGISYQSISECLFVEPAQRRVRFVKPTVKELRVSVDQLVSVGLLSVVPAIRRLVFRCDLAMAHKSERNLKGSERAEEGQTLEGRPEAMSGAACGGIKGRVYPQVKNANKGTPLMSKSNKPYNSVVAVVSNLPRAHVDRAGLINALAAACDVSGCLVFSAERIQSARVQSMVDDWVRAGVSAKTVSQTIVMVLARGVKLNSPAYLADAVREFADEQSGAAEARRDALRVPRADDRLEGWARENGFSKPGKMDSFADYRGKLSGELAEKMRGLN